LPFHGAAECREAGQVRSTDEHSIEQPATRARATSSKHGDAPPTASEYFAYRMKPDFHDINPSVSLLVG
jgi:hypothetical protein